MNFGGVTEENVPFFPEDKPFFVGEFNFGALDRGKFWTGIEYAADQRNRGEAYRHYVRSGLEDPRCIGTHWFSYIDGPLSGRPKDSENAAKGLVDSCDTPHQSMVDAIRTVSATMYDYRYADSVYTPPEVSPLLANWQFDDAAGTMSTAYNAAGLAVWADEADWMLNGQGQAEVSGVVNECHATPFTAVTNGNVFMRIDYAVWNFDGDCQIRAGFELDNQEVYVRLRGRPNNAFFGVGNANDQGISGVSSNGMSLILGVNLDEDTCSLWWDDGRSGTHMLLYADAALSATATSVETPYFRNTQFTGSNAVGIDMLLYGTNFNDVANFSLSPYQIWMSGYQLTGTDDDGDGLNNLAEFALGGNPTNPSENGYVPVFGKGMSNMVYVYPRRKDSGLTYWLETSTNLVSGVWTNAGYTEVPDVGGYDENFEAVTNGVVVDEDQTFIRLRVMEQ